ncbi:Predicted O-linked N-acetylglucosamine transferase, SPINDLY family [Rhizobium sp. NFR07]|uniref:O-linked N-acetylglucosamine transferase, SPINDLY family protein n=1 Tax=Rhizobium sp. NFR07 TaxID=1566262 RepID=UPI0008E38D6B|nr:glycosyl transferase [Rhizobium sp. NFR07]SFB10147.1 Predicted O-linked N-acetylglucosamine transferase, SPINDLY family [Rhizobium sp. NFR07]
MNITNKPNEAAAATLASLHHRAKTQQSSIAEVIKMVEQLNAAGLRAEASDLYKTWIAYNEDNPLIHVAYFNYSVVLRNAGDLPASMQALQMALKIDPAFGPAHINLGRNFEDSNLPGRAVTQWKAFATLTEDITADRVGHRLMVLQHIGRVLEDGGSLDGAENFLWQAMELAPHKPEAGQHWIGIRQQQCKWPVLTPSSHVTGRQMVESFSPMTLGCYSDDPIFQMARAYRYHKTLVGRPDTSGVARKPVRSKIGTEKRLRVGYVSSDLREHAVGFALCEMLELHDKSRVEVFAYYCGVARKNDRTHDRIRAAVDTWRDIGPLTDEQAAAQIIEDEIDVLIDVNGYTKEARAKIFAYRPAPAIVNFCGYPGTTASPYHQYMISDAVIVPPENEIYYTEKVLRIACDQPVDRKREIAERSTRAEAGLPEDAFVYACFNGTQKVTERCFARWMTILKATPGSILWLLSENATVEQHLRDLAEQAGVEPARLVFAQKTPNPKHLARIALADLFLDTFPYGAHSTAADAITMGLPVLTIAGRSFPARFCASIVAAAGIPELICATPEDYVARAVTFARDRESLAKVRRSLADQRETSVLRDIPGLARRLEELYWQIQGEAERDEMPVPDLRNLDIYYEIGAELVLENIEFEDNAACRQRYRDKLAKWNEYEPINPDNRLWPQSPD